MKEALMFFKVRHESDVTNPIDFVYIDTKNISITKNKVEQSDNSYIYTITKDIISIYHTDPILYSNTDENKVDQCLDFIVRALVKNKTVSNPPGFVIDLTDFGVPTILNEPGQLDLDTGQSAELNYNNIFHSDSSVPMTYTAVSSNSDSVIANVDSGSHAFSINAIAPGLSKVTLTATNLYGHVSTVLNVTVR